MEQRCHVQTKDQSTEVVGLSICETPKRLRLSNIAINYV